MVGSYSYYILLTWLIYSLYQDSNLESLGLFDSPYQDLNLQHLSFGLFHTTGIRTFNPWVYSVHHTGMRTLHPWIYLLQPTKI